jgi:hypothetical protein
MSKTKLALLVFSLAFGVNIFAFVFSKKSFLIEEVKNVWLYELPLTVSPLDSYVAVDFGPHNGVIGTLYRVMDKAEWKQNTLTIDLKQGLTFSNQEPILPEHWNQSRQWAEPYLELFKSDPLWNAYLSSSMEWKSPTQVKFSWSKLPEQLDQDAFLKSILSHPMTGVIHPANLTALNLPKAQQGKSLHKGWISSGPYKVRKWNPKEIVLISRDDYPATIPSQFFRTLKFQSAPVKNPACDFMQAQIGEEKPHKEHQENAVNQTLHIFWLCRSWKESGSFCASEQNRQNFAKIMSGNEVRSSLTLSSQKVRYRIPFGSDAFRNEITKKINEDVKIMGASVEEISYFFKPSIESDIELLFVVADSRISSDLAYKMALLSSRLDWQGVREKSPIPANLAGEYTSLPLQVLMKKMNGDAFTKVFLEADIEEKKFPL